jgi:signal transduction histidine kinase/CheY-like chemotaxis protein/ligand-binding sensor domain-containing protein
METNLKGRIFLLLLLVTVPVALGAGEGESAPRYRWSEYKHQLQFRRLNVNDGLSQSSVLSILQDSYGFMWFGTEDGLNRYDGYNFIVYRPDAKNPYSLSVNYIHSLYEDRQGNFWVALNGGGLERFDRERERFIHHRPSSDHPSPISSDNVIELSEDGAGNLWVATLNGGVNLVTHRGQGDTPARFKTFLHDPENSHSPGDNNILSLFTDSRGTLWLGTDGKGLNKLVIVDNEKKIYRFVRYRAKISSPAISNTEDLNRILAITEGLDGRLWLGTPTGLLSFDPGSEEFRFYAADPLAPGKLLNKYIHCAYRDRQGGTWLGSPGGGLSKMTLTAQGEPVFTNYTYRQDDPNGLSGNSVEAIYEDRTGVLWVGVYNGGLNKLPLNPGPGPNREIEFFAHYRAGPRQLSYSAVKSIYEDSKGRLWIGTDGGGINRVEPSGDMNAGLSFTYYKKNPADPAALNDNSVLTICEDSRGDIWAGTYQGGVNRLTPGSPGFKPRFKPRFKHYLYDPRDPASLSHNFINAIIRDSRDVMWVGTMGMGLNRYEPGIDGFTRFPGNTGTPSSLSNTGVTCMYEDRSGRFWIGTVNGLNWMDRDKETFAVYRNDPSNPRGLNRNFIRVIYQDGKGVLWVGTDGGGLNKCADVPDRPGQPLEFEHYTTAHGLPNNVVLSIMEDHQGNLWMGTNKGLCCFSPEKGVIRNYDVSDGLQSNEFKMGAALKSRSGELLIGGINGFNIFDPARLGSNLFIPEVVITDLLLFNRKVPVGEMENGRSILEKSITETREITLSHEDYVVSFEYAALHFVDPQKNRYAYRMEGLESEWNEVGDRRYAAYTTLPPGDYVFHVKASNNDGVWNETGVSLKIKVIPPFWKTWWFFLLAGLLAAAAVLTIHRFRVRGIKHRKAELEVLVDQRTRELQQANEEARRERETADAANQSKSEFLARMSHEIRTPMNAIIGFADMLLETPMNEDQMEYIRTINSSGEALIALLNDILDFSKVEAGELSFDIMDFDPEVTVFDVCELIQPRLEGRPVEVLVHIGDNVPAYVRSDAGRFRQVVLNLVGNAAKFTEEGEIEVTLKVAEEEKNRLKLHTIVRDTGPGIPAIKLDSIFDAFQQADTSITRKFGGTGLGLAICKQIVRLMEGELWAASEEEKGSVFHFTAWVDKSSKAPEKEHARESLMQKKALLVDDNPRNLEILAHFLNSAKMRVLKTNRPGQVIDMLKEHAQNQDPFDIAIFDIRMPELSGYDLASRVRSLEPPLSDVPLLAFSSFIQAGNRQFDEAGFDGFLPKPISKRRMLEMVERLLSETGRKKSKGTGEAVKPLAVTRHSLADEAKHAVHILLAEDNPVNRKLVHFMLTKAGYQLTMAENGREAVDIYSANPAVYDLILMDIQMPGLDGRQATVELRERGYTDVPIVALTAESMKGDKEKCLDAGMNDYISKPIKREDVFKTVKKWCLDVGSDEEKRIRG